MPGTRQPLALLEAKGKKHLSRAERAQRQAEEVRLPKPAKIPPPAWLLEELKKQFRSLTKQLIEADMGVAQLDQDAIARYLIAQAQYEAAVQLTQQALEQQDEKLAAEWSGVQDRFFKQARACANDMGLTLTSRCRLIAPPAAKEPENPFLQLLAEKERRQA